MEADRPLKIHKDEQDDASKDCVFINTLPQEIISILLSLSLGLGEAVPQQPPKEP